MTLFQKLISDVCDVVESSRLNGCKDRPSVINNIQNPMYNFSIVKVMTVCINAYASKYDIFRFSVTNLSQADLSKVRLT